MRDVTVGDSSGASRPSLYELSRPGLADLVRELDEPAYRADQIWGWLYARFAADFSEMTSLPQDMRDRLARVARLHTLNLVQATDSDDGLATKYLFRLADGQLVETVLMHYVDPADTDGASVSEVAAGTKEDVPSGRHTVCLSTQAGCAMGCVFCATGQMGLVRDLTPGECVEQLVYCARRLHRAGERLGNVVFMGMGEPLANWSATWETVQKLTDADAFGIGARRITISTVGIVPGIRRLAETGLPVRLAISVHAADPALRASLVPISATYPLDDVLAACRDYQTATGRRVTFEYVLIENVNDSRDQAALLAKRLKGLNAHVNLIPLNPTEGSPMAPTSYATAVKFQRVLQAAGIPTSLRMRRGIEIQAGCGQLRSRAERGLMGRTVPMRELVTNG